MATSAAAASTVSGTPPEPDPMVAKLHAEHAIAMQNSQSHDTLLATLAESSEMPQHVQEEEQPEQEANVDSEPERENGGFGGRFARNLRENLQKLWNDM